MDRGAWWAAVHVVAKSQTPLSDFTFTFHFHALEKEMATHSSVLAWGVPGTGEPGGLPSMGSQSQTRPKRLSSSSSSWNFVPFDQHLPTSSTSSPWQQPNYSVSMSSSLLDSTYKGDHTASVLLCLAYFT